MRRPNPIARLLRLFKAKRIRSKRGKGSYKRNRRLVV